MKYNRGGKSLKVGKIGRMSILRQHLLLPGESMVPQVRGNVRLSGLRQQTSVYLHASIECFAAPLRWYWTDLPEYLREGNGTARVPPTLTGVQWTANRPVTTQLGIGSLSFDFFKPYAQFPISIWNEWYRFNEDAREDVANPSITFYEDGGKPVVNLATAATRLHSDPETSFDTTEYQVPSGTEFDVRTLAVTQARFAQAAKQHWNSEDRYVQFMRDIYGSRGSNEVDKVPTRLRGGAELSVTPRDMYATDGGSLGELMSINNFQVNNTWRKFFAPEHMIVAYVMVLRFAPVLEDATIPGAYPANSPYSYYQGDVNVMAAQRPEPIVSREIDSDGDATIIGYLPNGWQWREGHTHVDWTVKQLNNFPLMDGQTQTAAGYRDASKINSQVFRSEALQHWFGDLDFRVTVTSRVPPASTSITAGGGVFEGDTRGLRGNHPAGGFLR